MNKLCVFAGTTEGRRLIERLAGRGAQIVACAATDYGGALLDGLKDVRVCTGRMDAAAMAAFLSKEAFVGVVDATHPYADRATENIQTACQRTGTPYHRLLRESGADRGDGRWFESAEACAGALKATSGNVYLTIGSKALKAFCADADLRARLFVRVLPVPAALEACAECGLMPDRIAAMQGPFDEALNAAMFRAANARYVVTKDTGGAGGYAEKCAAARRVGAQMMIIGRPPQGTGEPLEALAAHLEDELKLEAAKKRATLVGIGMGDPGSRTLAMERAVREADCLIGARRMLEAVDLSGKCHREAVRADDIAEIIQSDTKHRNFAVLFSGDTGFFSGAKKLPDILRNVQVDVLPGIGSLSYLCAKLRRPWEDVRPVSLHGRDGDLIGQVRRNRAVFVLLGGEGGAKAALERLVRADLGALTVHVGQRLGAPDERILTGPARDLCAETFDSLSVLLIENPHADAFVLGHGLPDEAFERDQTPMTRSEVRSVCMSKLRLGQGAIAYDVGSGSGSMSVEMARLAPEGHIYAVERQEAAANLTLRNAQRFDLVNLDVVRGEAPEAFSNLPAPTHAFIGGSSGRIEQIVEALLRKNARVRIVATAVTMETASKLTALSDRFAHSETVLLSVSKSRAAGQHRIMTAQNPVWIFTFQNGG